MIESQYSTKTEILRLLKTKGNAEAKALAGACGLTTMAIRRHLSDLRASGLIRASREHRPTGRPTAVYSLTEAGDAGFPRGYEEFACELLLSLRALDGSRKVSQVFRRRRKTMAERFLPRMKGKNLEQRAHEVAIILTECGYMADVSSKGRGFFLLSECNCALPQIARRFPVVCEEELLLIRDLVSGKVSRVCHMLAGDRVCSYVISK